MVQRPGTLFTNLFVLPLGVLLTYAKGFYIGLEVIHKAVETYSY